MQAVGTQLVCCSASCPNVPPPLPCLCGWRSPGPPRHLSWSHGGARRRLPGLQGSQEHSTSFTQESSHEDGSRRNGRHHHTPARQSQPEAHSAPCGRQAPPRPPQCPCRRQCLQSCGRVCTGAWSGAKVAQHAWESQMMGQRTAAAGDGGGRPASQPLCLPPHCSAC